MSGFDLQGSSLWHRIEGIGDEVEEQGLEVSRISKDRRKIGGEEGGEFHIPCMKPGFTQADQFFKDFIHLQASLTGVWVDG